MPDFVFPALAVHYLIPGVHSGSGAGVIGQNPQPGPEREIRDLVTAVGRNGDNAVFLIGGRQQESGGSPFAVTYQTVAIVGFCEAVPRSRDIAIQPASTNSQPFSAFWPITVVTTESAISSAVQTPRLVINRSKVENTPARTSVTPSKSLTAWAVGVDPTLTTGQVTPAARRRLAALMAAWHSARAACAISSCVRQ